MKGRAECYEVGEPLGDEPVAALCIHHDVGDQRSPEDRPEMAEHAVAHQRLEAKIRAVRCAGGGLPYRMVHIGPDRVRTHFRSMVYRRCADSSRPTLRSAAIGFLKEAEAPPRTDPDRQDRGAANHRNPTAAGLRPVSRAWYAHHSISAAGRGRRPVLRSDMRFDFIITEGSRREMPKFSVLCFRGAAHRLERSGLQRLNGR